MSKERRRRTIQLSERQKEIIEIVKASEPITSQEIAEKLGLTRAALRPDLSILTMAKILEAKPRVGYCLMQTPDRVGQLERMLEMKVGELQSHPAIVLESSSVYNAIVTLFLEDVGTIFVDDNEGYLVGIVSRKDLLKATIGESDIRQLPVGVIMHRMAIVTKPDENLYTAAKKLVDYKIDALPVVVEEKVNGKTRMKVVGRFSKTTLVNALINQCSEV